MKLRSPIVIAGMAACLALAMAGAAGCSAAPSAAGPRNTPGPQYGVLHQPVAEVTGFKSDGGMLGADLSGPVRVRVTGTSASRLAQLVSLLHPVAYVHCEDPLGLIYQIAFSAGSVARSKAVVDGYRCDGAVTIKTAGKPILWRRDSTCALIDAVRLVLPGRARATRDLAIGCNN